GRRSPADDETELEERREGHRDGPRRGREPEPGDEHDRPPCRRARAGELRSRSPGGAQAQPAADGISECRQYARTVAVGARPAELLEGEELAYRGLEPSRAARTAPLPDALDPRVRDALGVPALYAHQRDVWDAAARGKHVVVTTGTASGKTLAFNLPVLDSL